MHIQAIDFNSVRFARRIPDPYFNDLDRHILVVPVHTLPRGIPDDPNARSPKTNKRVYRTVRESLFNRDDSEPGTFHLKNGGITVIAHKVRKIGDTYRVSFQSSSNQGIVDGGHTYKIIVDSQEDSDLPSDQFVLVQVLTGVDPSWIPSIAGGLNTSVQVQPMSLQNSAQAFQWMKDTLKDEAYFDQIAWEENQSGEFDARDLVALLCLFNVELHPNDISGISHPIYSYEKKSTALNQFVQNPNSFKKMKPLLKDILVLHDTIRRNYRSSWNEEGGSAGNLAISERKERMWHFTFTGERSQYRMVNGALYPMLGAFRWFVSRSDKSDVMMWRNGFDDVLSVWQQCAPTLIKVTQDVSKSLAYKQNAIGKSMSHWNNLYNQVALFDLNRRSGQQP